MDNQNSDEKTKSLVDRSMQMSISSKHGETGQILAVFGEIAPPTPSPMKTKNIYDRQVNPSRPSRMN